MTRKTDGHNAGKSGSRAQQRLNAHIRNVLGLTFFTNQKDQSLYKFHRLRPNGDALQTKLAKEYYKENSKYIIKELPKEWKDDGFNQFKTDGYLIELDTNVELKYGTKQGTTEEKLEFDFDKIKSGVYDKTKLVYFIAGSHLSTCKHVKRFIRKVEELNIGDKVKVVVHKNIEDLTIEDLTF